MRKLAFALAIAPALLASQAVLACQGKSVIFEDTFQDDTGGWEEDKLITIANSALKVALAPQNTSFRELNATFFSKDGDYCAEMIFPQPAQEDPAGGIMFWGTDYQNFYLFQIKSSGRASLYRQAAGKWVTVYDAENSAVKREPGAVNLVRVVAKGNLISTYVNGQKVRDQRGQIPAGETRFGFYFQVDKPVANADSRVFTLKSYKVTGVD